MSPVEIVPPDLRRRSLFLVWGPPSHGPRSKVFSRELGIEIRNVFSTRRRGGWVAPWKYGFQAAATVILLVQRRPRLIFVQSPPSFAAMIVAAYCVITRARFLVDAHSAALQSRYWTRPAWLYSLVSRTALVTVVTNEVFASRIRAVGGRALVLRDIPTSFPIGPLPSLGSGFDVMVVNTFARDEPLVEVVAAARELSAVTFHVTGDPERGRTTFELRSAPSNVLFTGYLADPDYYALMSAVDAVMCLTIRDDTMQRGACEALTIGTPIITSDWPLLRDYFHDGTVHVAADPASIVDGVRRAQAECPALKQGIVRLRQEQWNEWVAASEALASLIRG